MRKRTIVILYIVSMMFLIGIVVDEVNANSIADPAHRQYCQNPVHIEEDRMCYTIVSSGMDRSVRETAAGLVVFVLGCFAWAGALVRQGIRKQWGWFASTLIFSVIVLPLYLIVVPASQRLSVPAYGRKPR